MGLQPCITAETKQEVKVITGLISLNSTASVLIMYRKKMEQKELSYRDTARLCMETLMEKWFSGAVEDNTLFMLMSDGKTIDGAIAGKGINLVNTLCGCCADNPEAITIMAKAVKIAARQQIDDKLQELIDDLNKIKEDEDEQGIP